MQSTREKFERALQIVDLELLKEAIDESLVEGGVNQVPQTILSSLINLIVLNGHEENKILPFFRITTFIQ